VRKAARCESAASGWRPRYLTKVGGATPTSRAYRVQWRSTARGGIQQYELETERPDREACEGNRSTSSGLPDEAAKGTLKRTSLVSRNALSRRGRTEDRILEIGFVSSITALKRVSVTVKLRRLL